MGREYKVMSGMGPLAPPSAKSAKSKGKSGKESETRPTKKAKRSHDHTEEVVESQQVAKKPNSKAQKAQKDQIETSKHQKSKKKGKAVSKLSREDLKKKMARVYDDATGEGQDEAENGEEDDQEAGENTIYVKKADGKLGPSVGDDFDDEEIDEDEAFNSEDEGQYDDLDEILRRTSKQGKKNGAKGGRHEKYGAEEDEEGEEEDEYHEDEDEDDDDEEMDISDLIGGPLGDELLSTGRKAKVNQELGGSDSEDEVYEDEEEERVNQIGQFIQGLVTKKRKRVEQMTEAYKESEYNLAPKGDQHKVGLTDLLSSLKDSSNTFNEVTKKLKTLAKSEAMPVPLAKVIQDRVDRKAAYAHTKEDISKWQDTVQENRKAEHLSFPLGQPKLPFQADPKMSLPTAPANDFEREINEVLMKEGLKQKGSDEDHVLPHNAPTLEELEDARAELGKLRSMMFFYQQKSKRLKKIKSKKYHKILKKDRLKKELSLHEIAMLDPEKAAAMKERMLLDRAAERVSLRHKSGGKWAKDLQKRGIRNEQTRDAVNAKNRMSEDLRRKIAGIASDSEEEEANYNYSDASDDELDEKFDEEVEREGPVETTKGLMALKFMKSAAEKEKKDAREMIQRMQSQEQEFDDMLSEEESEEEEEFDENSDGESMPRERKPKVKESKKKLSQSEQTGRRTFGPEGTKGLKKDAPSKVFEEEEFPDVDTPKASQKVMKAGEQKPERKLRVHEAPSAHENDEASGETHNPWLAPEENVVLKVKSTKKSLKQGEAQALAMKKDRNLRRQEAVDDDDEFEEKPGFVVEDSETTEFAIKQRELIQRAFANDDVVEKDFMAEKEALVDQETNKDQDVTLPGWGSWGGEGAKPRKKKIIIPANPQEPRKDRHLKNVIINEKSMKTTAKFTVEKVPYPFTSKEQYERSIRNPLGREWNTSRTVIALTKPRIATKAGTILEPIQKPHDQ